MIITIYFSLLVLSFVILIAGYQYNSVVLITLGFSFLFIANIPVLTNGIEYQTGHNDIVTGSLTERTYTYSAYNVKTIPIFLMVLGMLGASYSIYFEREERKRGKNE